MVTRSSDSSHFPQGDDGMTSAQPLSVDQLKSRAGNTVFKSGPLFISSKGIGWTSWKKRWFILTRTSLVFFRSDPNAVPQKGGEANLTLGGIDLNSSGSVVIRADKKLLTVLFPDGRDGRAFTLKAETSEDMYEWKTALENALAQAPSGATAIENTLSQAPSAALLMGKSGSHRDDAAEAIEGAFEQWRDKRPVKSVVGTPVLFALEDDDGSPSFLEKALRFIEQYGVKVEGIFRQAADVDDVERRIHEFEQGRNEFSPDEDAHVIADCVKHILREMSSAPIPATCCSSLLDAFKRNQGSRVNAMRDAIFETFPEPNCLLLQRILKMMRIVASHKSENLMSTSAVAACMAPLLLRPLLAGDCEVEDNFDVGGDGSIQLLQAAAAANHAQAIVIILLEEFRNIFLDDEGSFSTESYSGSEGSGDEDEIFSDDEVLEDGSYNDEENDIDLETEEDYDSDDLDSEIETGSETEDDHDAESDLDLVSEVDPEEENEQEIKDDLERKQSSSSQDSDFDNKVSERLVSDSESPKVSTDVVSNDRIPIEIHIPLPQHHEIQCNSNLRSPSENHSDTPSIGSQELLKDVSMSTSPVLKTNDFSLSSPSAISPNTSNETLANVKRTAKWGRTAARKDLSAESLDCPNDEEVAIRDLEITKAELQNNIAKEARENATSLANLKGRKQAFHERRLALEQDVARLQEQLQKEKDLREIIEAGPNMPLEQLTISSIIDGKIRAEIEELAHAEADVLDLKQKAADLQMQLNQYLQQNPVYICESCKTLKLASNHQEKKDQEDFKAIATEHCQRSPRHKSPEKQKQPELATNDSTKFTMATCLSSESENVKTRSLSSTKKQVFQNQLTNSKRHNRTKSVETMASSFSNFEDIVKHDQSASSNKKPLQKQQTDVKNYKNTKSTADTTSSTDNENVPTQDPTRLPNKQLSRKQWRGFTHHRSTKSTETIASPSAGSQDIITQDPPLSKKQPSKKLQKDPLSGSTKSTDAKTSSSNEETSTIVHNVSSSKRSTGKGEGTASSSSALTRLTKGFNFLKDKRPQNTNELQTLDASGNPVPEYPKPGPPQRSHSE